MGVVTEANKVPFHVLFKNLEPKAMQMRCPFADERHSAGDRHKSARYYPDTNRIYCYMEAKSWTPVSLLMEKLKLPALEVARMILKRNCRESIDDRKSREFLFLRRKLSKRREEYELLYFKTRHKDTWKFIFDAETESKRGWGLPFQMVTEVAESLDEFINEVMEEKKFEQISKKE